MRLAVLLPAALLLLGACSEKAETESEVSAPQTQKISVQDFEKKVFSFNRQNIGDACSEDSQIVCAINLAVRCTINPQMSDCAKNQGRIPKFIFMQDENLGRPDNVSYQIVKMKPIAGGQVEVYTQSSCDGKWFGLCQGNIIYVMAADDTSWRVDDIYAIEGN